jgi:hypothetical protein
MGEVLVSFWLHEKRDIDQPLTSPKDIHPHLRYVCVIRRSTIRVEDVLDVCKCCTICLFVVFVFSFCYICSVLFCTVPPITPPLYLTSLTLALTVSLSFPMHPPSLSLSVVSGWTSMWWVYGT